MLALLSEIRSKLRALPDNSASNLRNLRRVFGKQLTTWPPEMVVALALRLLEESTFEARFIAYELILHHPPALRSLGTKEVEKLGAGLDRWAAVDTFACYLSGPAWREKQIPDALLRKWANSKDRWWRRAALVSTVPLNNKARGGRGDAARTTMLCQLLVEDRDDMVVKALSWALRELVKRDPSVVRQFIRQHENKLAPRVLREVRNKLESGLKNPRRKAGKYHLAKNLPKTLAPKIPKSKPKSTREA